MGRADYEFDGYLVSPGQVVASGELRMAADALSKAFGRRDLSLRTDDGRVLAIRPTGRRQGTPDVAHVDVVLLLLERSKRWLANWRAEQKADAEPFEGARQQSGVRRIF